MATIENDLLKFFDRSILKPSEDFDESIVGTSEGDMKFMDNKMFVRAAEAWVECGVTMNEAASVLRTLNLTLDKNKDVIDNAMKKRMPKLGRRVR